MPFTVTDVSSALSSRSWKAQLSSLNETIKNSKLEGTCCAPWFQDILHLEPPGNHSTSVPNWAFTPQDVMCSQYSFPQKGPAKTSDSGRSWKRIHISEQEEPLELTCMSVTGFTALFTWAVERTGCTIVLWDLETQSMQCFSLGKKCIPVDSGGDQQLCLVLTGENVLYQVEIHAERCSLIYFTSAARVVVVPTPLSLGFDGENLVLLSVMLSHVFDF